MIRKVVIVLFLSVYYLLTFAESASIKGIKVIPDSYNNGENGILFKVTFDVSGRMGKSQKVSLYFQYRNGSKVSCGNSQYHATDGQLAVSSEYTPRWDNSSYTDFEIFFPYVELHKAGANGEMKIQAIIWGNNQALATSTSEIFTFSDLSRGCPYCYNTGRCRTCRGSGRGFYGTACPICKGAAVCSFCNGSGEHLSLFCYVPGNNNSTNPKVEQRSSSNTYVPRPRDNGYDNSSTDSNWKTRPCTSCNGTGWVPGRNDYQFERYADSDPNYKYRWCPQCHQDHYNLGIHRRCTVCEGKKEVIYR